MQSELQQKVYDELFDEAYTEACELLSPNDIGFDSLHEQLFEEALEAYYKGE